MKNLSYLVVFLSLFLVSANAYTLTINQPSNGILKCATANENPVIIPCKSNWSAYDKLLIIAKPKFGYELYEWRGNCSETFLSADCFLNMDSNKIVSAGFKKAPMYNLTITQPTHGKIYCNGGTCKSQYPKGTKVSLSVIVSTGYKFIKWDGGSWGESSENPLKIIVSENKNYIAIVEKIETEALPQSNNGGGFDFERAGSGSKGGSGDFQQQIESWNNDPEKTVTVGTIPKDLKDVDISLKSNKDVDIRLYDVNGKKIVHWPNGILNGSGKGTTTYNGVTIKYSGYNGDGTGLGHEYIKITGTTQNDFIMKAFGYKAGYAKVDYSWAGKANFGEGSTPSVLISGDFEQQIIQKDIVKVGDIPLKVNNLYITLKSDEDVDIHLYDKDTGTKIIVWPDGILSGSGKQNTNYKGTQIEWSGYNGDGTGLGHEYIKITGETTCNLIMKAYGYKAGYAKVHYEWGENKNIKLTGFVRDNNKEVVIDYDRNLMWQDDIEVKTTRKPWVNIDIWINFLKNHDNSINTTSGDTATTYCNNLTLGDYYDWRLPTVFELRTIIDTTSDTPPYIENSFQNIVSYPPLTAYTFGSYSYWTSSSIIYDLKYAAFVDFYKKYTKNDIGYLTNQVSSFSYGGKSSFHYVRCVRN